MGFTWARETAVERRRMGASALPIVMFTLLWGLVGGVLPYFVPEGPHKKLFQVCLMMTGATCWLFWLCCYMSQMNPLIGPVLGTHQLAAMHYYWGDVDGLE